MPARKLVALLFTLSLVVAAPAEAKKERERPTRVIILVLDQARPDTITRYGMENVQRLQREGMNFPNALVGHMAAETVISHNVLTSGLFPKHMGWTNEVYRDTEGVVTPADDYHITSSMSCAQYDQLIEHDGGYPKLQDYLDNRFGELSMFASISQKRSSACTAGHVSRAADSTDDDAEDLILQIRGDRQPICLNREWRQPEDGNQPAPGTPSLAVAALFPELVDPACDRWSTDQAPGGYGTGSISPANIYPLDTNRFVPGFDEDHLGGDVWAADAAINVIEKTSNWRGMMISLGGIDKLGHMWGPEDEGFENGVDVDNVPGTEAEMRHLPFVARTADEQVGRLVDTLEDQGVLDETLIVITADHAAQTGVEQDGSHEHFHGELAPGETNPRCGAGSSGIRSDCNWYFGSDLDEIYLDPSDPVDELRERLGGNLAMSYQDGHVAAWLDDDSDALKREAALAVLDMPDVIASFRINAAHDDYRLHDTNPMSGRERAWFARHGEELVDTMAHPSGPDVVGLVNTDVTYGVAGDHGGHNKLIQNIPMVLYGAGVGAKDSNREMRHVDVVPTVLDLMGIPYDEDSFDGEAVKVSKPR
jgi:Type I phosphodiesterase / nucleotide pyrophosphatase